MSLVVVTRLGCRRAYCSVVWVASYLEVVDCSLVAMVAPVG